MTSAKKSDCTSEHKLTSKGRAGKIIIGIVVAVIVILFAVMKIHTANKEKKQLASINTAVKSVDSIMEALESVREYLEDGDYVYGSVKSDAAVKNVTLELDEIQSCIEDVNTSYGTYDLQICQAIDQYIQEHTGYGSWHDLTFDLAANYFVADTSEESANVLIQAISYSSVDEYNQAQKEKIPPEIGMTEAEVKKSSWGSPSRTYPDPEGNGECWSYGDGRMVYFKDGVVTRIIED